MANIYIFNLYIYLQGSIYAYMPCIDAYMAMYTLALNLHCIYIYIYICIYMQHETLNKHAQATDAAGSSSQHSIKIQ